MPCVSSLSTGSELCSSHRACWYWLSHVLCILLCVMRELRSRLVPSHILECLTVWNAMHVRGHAWGWARNRMSRAKSPLDQPPKSSAASERNARPLAPCMPFCPPVFVGLLHMGHNGMIWPPRRGGYLRLQVHGLTARMHTRRPDLCIEPLPMQENGELVPRHHLGWRSTATHVGQPGRAWP